MFRQYLPELRRQSLERGRPTSIAELMEDFWKSPFEFSPAMFAQGGRMSFPAMNLAEQDDTYVVSAELPGMKPEDVTIQLENGVLTISGEKKFEEEENKENFHRIERSYGSFSRSLRLPGAVADDKTKAQYKDGVLTVTMPKSEDAKRKKIEIAS